MDNKRYNIYKYYNIILTVLLCSILLLQYIVRIWANYKVYPIYSTVFSLIFLAVVLLVALCTKSSGISKSCNINRILLALWLLLCICMLYSDLAVRKRYGFVGLILLVPFTALFLVFTKSTQDVKSGFFKCFINAVEISFIISTIFCIMFRPHADATRYCGIMTNPNVYAKYLVTVWVCLLTKLDEIITNDSKRLYSVINGFEIGILLTLLYRTGARTSFLAIACTLFVWFCIRLYKNRREGRPVIRYIASCFIGSLAGMAACFILLSAVPNIINHPVNFNDDKVFVAESDRNICYASEIPEPDKEDYNSASPDNAVSKIVSSEESEPALFQRIMSIFQGGQSLDVILNNRISIFKSYLGSINVRGHRKYSKNVNGNYVANAHNSFIQMAYTYGIPSVIVYIILNLFVLVTSIKHYIKNIGRSKYAALPMLITIAFLITSMFEAMIVPMHSLLAFSYYLGIGEIITSA